MRRYASAPLETLSHTRGHRLVLGAGGAAEEAYIAATSSWSGALVIVDKRIELASKIWTGR